MAKRHRKRPVGSEEDDLGCIWCFITMFDYRSGHKLLPERRHGSGNGYSKSKFDIVRNLKRKPESFNDVNRTEEENVSLGSVSIRTLMEEEMSAHLSTKFSNPEDEKITSYLGFGGNVAKNHKQSGRNVLTSDRHDYDSKTSADKSNWSNCTNKSDMPSGGHDLAALMLENNRYQEKKIDFINKIDILAPGSNHQDEPTSKLTEKHVINRKGRYGVIEDIQNHKSTYAEQITGTEEIYQCKELIMDALESPNVNNDLFLKFLEDPNLHFLKHLQELQNAEAGKFSAMDSPRKLEGCKLLERDGRSGKTLDMVRRKALHIQNVFFWKKDKSKWTKPSDDRIFILKPNPSRNQSPLIFANPEYSPQSDHSLQRKKGTERIGSNFFLKEIKRKLWSSNGENRKEALLITSDGILHRIPNGSLNSADMGEKSSEGNIPNGLQSQTSCNNEDTALPYSKLRNQKCSPEECADDDPQMIDTKSGLVDAHNIRYSPTIKLKQEMDTSHLNSLQQDIASALCTDTCQDDERKVLDSNLRERGVRLKECQDDDSQMLDTNPGLLDTQKVSPVYLKQEMDVTHLNPLKQDIVSALCTDICQDDDPQMPDSNAGLLDTHIQLGSDKISKENKDTCMEERETSDSCKGEGITSALLSGIDSTDERPQQTTSSDSILCRSELVHKLELPRFYFKNPEHLSPVSVIEPFPSEDISSSGSTTLEHFIQARQPHFEEEPENSEVVIASPNSGISLRACTEEKEAIFGYVRSLLKAAGISYDKLLKRGHPSDPLLDPFLFDEAQILSSNLPDAPKILFDCTNEVLEEIWERVYRCTSWLSIIRPDVRISAAGGNLIQEVCKDIDRRLDSHYPYTLDHTIRKDMHYETWMNHRRETESTVFELGDTIFEDLIEEIVLIL